MAGFFEKIENEKSNPHPDEILAMSEGYKKPELCNYFSRMNQYFIDIKAKKLDNVNMNCLSMGMSSDYEEAILCGATMVRVGSSLFGERIYI